MHALQLEYDCFDITSWTQVWVSNSVNRLTICSTTNKFHVKFTQLKLSKRVHSKMTNIWQGSLRAIRSRNQCCNVMLRAIHGTTPFEQLNVFSIRWTILSCILEQLLSMLMLLMALCLNKWTFFVFANRPHQKCLLSHTIRHRWESSNIRLVYVGGQVHTHTHWTMT